MFPVIGGQGMFGREPSHRCDGIARDVALCYKGRESVVWCARARELLNAKGTALGSVEREKGVRW